MSFDFDSDINRKVDLEKASRLPDSHMHTKWCNHAELLVQDFVDMLIEKNIDGVINEHIHIPERYVIEDNELSLKGSVDLKNEFRDNVLKFEEIDLFIEDIKNAKNTSKLKDGYLPVGFEIDGLIGFEDDIESNMNYLIDEFEKNGLKVNHFSLSLHLIRGYWSYGDTGKLVFDEYTITEIINIYFDDFLRLIDRIKNISFICHPGLLRLFLKRSKVGFEFTDDEFSLYVKRFKEVIDKCIEKDIGVEINTTGIRKVSKDSPYIPYEVFRYAFENGAKFVTSSDFHKLGQELYCYDQLYDLLVKEGVKIVYKVRDHKLVPVEL